MWHHDSNLHFVVACIVLLLASYTHGKPTTSFADYLASKQAPAARAYKLQSDYDHVDVAQNCLREVSNKYCRIPAGDNNITTATYFESGVTCCDGRGNSGNSLGNSALDVGSCKFNQFFYPDSITEAPGVDKLGEFTVQCYLNSAAEACGHPFCEQMVLSAGGGIYLAYDVVLASRPSGIIFDDSCSGRRRLAPPAFSRYVDNKLGMYAKKFSSADATVRTAKSSGEPSPTLYSGLAMIYFGPMSVNSRVHNVKYSDGWLEYVYLYVDGDPISEGDAEGKHVVNPYTYDLKFYSPSTSQY